MKIKLYLSAICYLISSFSFAQPKFEKAIEQILDHYAPSKLEPGLTVGIVQNGKLIFQASRGLMNLEYKLPFNDSTIIPLASVSKQFTSACIGILAKQNKLSIDDDVSKYIPELSHFQESIQIRHLLNHTSGLRNHNVLLNLSGFDYKHRGYTNKMIQELSFKQKGLNNTPGEKMLYTNTNYVLLALVVERVSGLSIVEFAEQEIFKPLKMNQTFFSKDLEDVIENRAYSYYKQGGKFKQPQSLTHCIGAGGVGSTVQDLSKWSQVFLDPKHPFSFLKEFITDLDTLSNGTQMKHARGMFVSSYKGVMTYNHSGRDLGMRSQFICIPENQLAIITFTNAEHLNAVNLSYEILDLFVEGNLQDNKKIDSFKHSKLELKRFTGTYQELNSDLRMNIFMEKDTLKAQSSFGQEATALVSQNARSLSRIDNPSIVYTFSKEVNQDADLLVDFGGAIFYFERIQLATQPNQNLAEYDGNYYSQELNVTYLISHKNDKLYLSYPNQEEIEIKEGAVDTFGANQRTKYTFKRNTIGEVVAFEVASEGTVKEIVFELMD